MLRCYVIGFYISQVTMNNRLCIVEFLIPLHLSLFIDVLTFLVSYLKLHLISNQVFIAVISLTSESRDLTVVIGSVA